MQDLKDAAYGCWKLLHVGHSAVPQPELFKPEVRRLGDLRFKATWEKAYCYFKARALEMCCLNAYELITVQFNLRFTENDPKAYLLPQALDEFLGMPEGLELIKTGLEQIFGPGSTTQDREDAKPFFEMVAGEPITGGRITIDYSHG